MTPPNHHQGAKVIPITGNFTLTHVSVTGRRAKLAPLKAFIVSIRELTLEDRERMYELMRKYYDAITREQFLADLSKKDAVILLRDKAELRIQGFSTLLKLSGGIGRRRVRAIFSGDTIVEKAYWGQTALGKAFLKYLWLEKARHPFQPLYWLLISKGYKTYLMMANNFSEYYPRHDRATPLFTRKVLNGFYGMLYPGYFKASTGLITFPDAPCRLKAGVAEIDRELLATNPKVAHFQKLNPGWRDGNELACIARMTLFMPLQYSMKCVFKRLRRKEAPVRKPGELRMLHERRQES